MVPSEHLLAFSKLLGFSWPRSGLVGHFFSRGRDWSARNRVFRKRRRCPRYLLRPMDNEYYVDAQHEILVIRLY